MLQAQLCFYQVTCVVVLGAASTPALRASFCAPFCEALGPVGSLLLMLFLWMAVDMIVLQESWVADSQAVSML